MALIRAIQQVAVPQQRVGMQIDDGQRLVQRLRFVGDFDQRFAVDLVHAPLDHAGAELEEACDAEDEAKAEKLEQRRDQVVGELQDAEDALQGYAPEVREVADFVVFLASARASYTSGIVYTITGGV